MPEQWYEVVAPTEGLLQGDLILNCPILDWKPTPPEIKGENEAEQLKHSLDMLEVDIVIMTQACDLEQKNVNDVVVCPLYSLEQIKTAWTAMQVAAGQGVSSRAWKSFCDDMRKGFIWNMSMLNHGKVDGQEIDHRVVDFHKIHTIPLPVLQAIAAKRGPRFRLRPPYREHLSQAFARYFMRVGLPSNVETAW